jgi:membrane fusion protein (multidrug efflux system)
VATSKKILGGILFVLLLAGGVLFSWKWWTLGRFLQRTDNAYVEADISVIAPKVAGLVSQILVTDNQSVPRGTRLVLIDDRDLHARLEEARARLAGRAAALESFKRESELQSAAVERASADVESATAEDERAERDLGRYEQLARARLISPQGAELATIEARKTQAALTSARAALAVEQRRIRLIAARREEVVAAIAEAQANVAQAELDLESAVVRAPVDGVVGNRKVRVGQYVHAGTPLMAVTPLSSTYIVANFKETQLERMRPGQPVTIDLDAYPSNRLEGAIESLAPAAASRFALLPPENATGNFTKIVQRIPVRVRLQSDHALLGRIRPGMSAIATVDTK